MPEIEVEDNGRKDTLPDEMPGYKYGVPTMRRSLKSEFEKDLLTAGQTVLDSLPTAVFRDEQAAIDACLYLGWLSMFNLEDEKMVALWKINATMAIEGRARDDAIQAHGLLFYPRHASKEDKKMLYEMQKNREKKGSSSEDGAQ